MCKIRLTGILVALDNQAEGIKSLSVEVVSERMTERRVGAIASDSKRRGETKMDSRKAFCAKILGLGIWVLAVGGFGFPQIGFALEAKDLVGYWDGVTLNPATGEKARCSFDVWLDGDRLVVLGANKGLVRTFTENSFRDGKLEIVEHFVPVQFPKGGVRLRGTVSEDKVFKFEWRMSNNLEEPEPGDFSGTGEAKWVNLANAPEVPDADLTGTFKGQSVVPPAADGNTPQTKTDFALTLEDVGKQVSGKVKIHRVAADGERSDEYTVVEIRRSHNRIFISCKGENDKKGRLAGSLTPTGFQAFYEFPSNTSGEVTLKK